MDDEAELIKDVIQGMLSYLNNAQSEKLQEVLQFILASYEVEENKDNEKRPEPLSERRNIVVMADEAHRGQYGLKEKVDAKTGRIKVGTARIIRNTLPNATYIGFIGTLISMKDRSTGRCLAIILILMI